MSHKSTLFRLARVEYLDEIKSGDVAWQLCRLTTLVDLIIVSLEKHSSFPSEKSFIELVNSSIKSLIIFEFGELKMGELSPTAFYERLSKTEDLAEKYDKVVSNLDLISSFSTTLIDEENYLRMYSRMDIREFPEKSIFHIVKLATENLSK